ncbi:MAG: chemotaxis protein CheX [Campylobacterota bacterium]|nr:chemotaxis protein CheX [Campylobacterota bacterium]
MKLDSKILEKLAIRTISYLVEDLGMKSVENNFHIKQVDFIEYKKLSSFISLSLDLKGTLFMSVDNSFANEMVKGAIYGDVSKDVLDELSAENLSETLNIVVGNIISQIDIIKDGGKLEISTPTLVDDKNKLLKKRYDTIYICKIIHNKEEMILGYFI